jgi:hypothetical protein
LGACFPDFRDQDMYHAHLLFWVQTLVLKQHCTVIIIHHYRERDIPMWEEKEKYHPVVPASCVLIPLGPHDSEGLL